MIDSVLKNDKPFFTEIDNYQDISAQIQQLFSPFWPVKFWSRDWAPQTLSALSIHKHPHCVQISALHVKWFLSYKQINNFSRQK